MDRKQLLFFKRTAELEHMTNAAEELLVSQPFLSRTIAELEDELGVKLFDHVGRRIELNQCGKAFYSHVVKIFNEADDAIKEVREIQKIQQTELSVATNVGLYLPKLLSALKENHPELRITQYSEKLHTIEKMLLDGVCDFAISCPSLAENPDLQTIELLIEPGVVIYPKGHRFEQVKSVGFEDTQNDNLICVAKGYGTRDVLISVLKKINLTPNIAIETADTSSVFKYVSDGLGIAVAPFSQVLLDNEYKNRYALVSTPGTVGTVSLSWRKGKFLTKTENNFINETKAHFLELTKFIQDHSDTN